MQNTMNSYMVLMVQINEVPCNYVIKTLIYVHGDNKKLSAFCRIIIHNVVYKNAKMLKFSSLQLS